MTDERDLHDPALDAAWRAHATETPPPALDAAILAAAHRAVKSAPEKIGPGREATRPWRWWTPLAAAAVIGVIAVGALQLLPHEPDPTQAVVSDAPSTMAKTEVVATPPPAATAASPSPPAVVAALPQAADRAPAPAESREEKVAAQRGAPEPFPARKDAAPAASESNAAGSAGIAPVPASPKSAATPAPVAAPTQPRAAPASPPAAAAGAMAPMLGKRAMREEAQPPRAADDFVARIRHLLAEGNVDEAQRELVAFRAAYADADARLPADLRPWAAAVPKK